MYVYTPTHCLISVFLMGRQFPSHAMYEYGGRCLFVEGSRPRRSKLQCWVSAQDRFLQPRMANAQAISTSQSVCIEVHVPMNVATQSQMGVVDN